MYFLPAGLLESAVKADVLSESHKLSKKLYDMSAFI